MPQNTALEVRALPVDRVHPDPTQPRKIFTQDKIAELAASIREKGLLQPITVRRQGDAFVKSGDPRRRKAG